MFRPATKKQTRLRMAIDGPAGSGKTFTALRIATGLGKRIAVINSESGAVEKYLGAAPDGVPFSFDICTLDNFSPSEYTVAITAAGRARYDVLIIDSLTHAWDGVGGALEMVDKASGDNKFTAWKDVTPLHRRMVESILRSPCHIIATMRSKIEYVLERNDQGKMIPVRVGLKPIQRTGMEYEFDVFVDMDHHHVLEVCKTRCPDLDGIVEVKPGMSIGQRLLQWLNEGSEVEGGYYTASEEEIDKILREREAAAMKRSGITVHDQAKEQRKILEEKLRKKRENAESPPATPPASPGPDDSYEMTADVPTYMHLERVKELISEMESEDADIVQKVKAKITAHGIRRLADMAKSDLDLLEAALRKKAMQEFFDSSLNGAPSKN